MTDDAMFGLPKDSWVDTGRSVLRAGGDAATKALETLVMRTGASAVTIAEKASGNADEDSRRQIRAHTLLARSQGFAVASSLTAAEVGTVIGTAGTMTPAAVVVGLMAALTGLAWIQVRMVLVIAALHGFDPRHPDRLKEIGALMGFAATARGVAAPVKKGVPKALKRLTLRHLQGDNLKAVKAMFDLVGIKFYRNAFVKQLPFVSIPISVMTNGAATKALGKRALVYYNDLALKAPR